MVVNTCSLFALESSFLLFDNYYHGIGHEAIKTGFHTLTEYALPETTVCYSALVLILFYIGTLLPDIDNENSMLGRHFHLPLEHRVWTHAIWIPALLFVGSYYVRALFWLGLGYILHLFWDSFSYCGVCYFYPFSKYRKFGNTGAKVKRKHILKIYRAGKPSEYVVVTIIVILTIGLLIWGLESGLYQPILKHFGLKGVDLRHLV